MKVWLRVSLLDKVFLLFLILIFVFIRSIHFKERLDFSTDQATSSSVVLEMARNHHPILIGPRFTLEYRARYMFFGPAPYYFQAPFMILGNFDPIISSYLFMLFSSLMIIPLFLGVKMLISERAATLMGILFTLLPFFVNYSGFIWNPNSQFVLLPVLVFLMGIFQQKNTYLRFFFVSLASGILLEFHFIFLFIILGLLIYYFAVKRFNWKYILIFLSGLVLGMLPLILFDIRNKFYSIKTVWIFITHWREVLPAPGTVSSGDPHYFLPFVFFGALMTVYLIRRYLSIKLIVFSFLLLLIWSLILYIPAPTHAYGMVPDWNYPDEQRVHQIISSQNITNYNIVNLGYDTIAEVQKYLLKKDGININYYDYWYNNYLYIITDKQNFLKDPSYEVHNITPAILINVWDINSRYKLYLVKKVQ